MLRSFCILGRVGGISPGVTGAASEHPLEGVADGSTGSPTFIQPLAWRNRSEGDSSPSHTQKKGRSILLLRSLMLLDPIASYGRSRVTNAGLDPSTSGYALRSG